MTACPRCGVDPVEHYKFMAERVTYWKSAWQGQRDLSRELARQLAALKEKRT